MGPSTCSEYPGCMWDGGGASEADCLEPETKVLQGFAKISQARKRPHIRDNIGIHI